MSPEASQEDHDALAERRSDQGVWNGAMGQAALDGFYGDTHAEKPQNSPANRKTRKPASERDGRTVSLDILKEFAANNPPLADQKKVNSRGAALARANIVKGEKRW